MATTQPIRNKHQVRELAHYYLKRGQIRNYVLIVMSVNSALRIGDTLRMTWDDVYDFDRCCVRTSVTIKEKKTGKVKTIALNDKIRAALTLLSTTAQPGVFIFLSRKGENMAISRIQAYRIIREASDALGYAQRVSCHSLRKTFGYHAWKSGVSPAVIMEIYNHSSLSVTRRYLGVTQDDLNDCYTTVGNIL